MVQKIIILLFLIFAMPLVSKGNVDNFSKWNEVCYKMNWMKPVDVDRRMDYYILTTNETTGFLEQEHKQITFSIFETNKVVISGSTTNNYIRYWDDDALQVYWSYIYKSIRDAGYIDNKSTPYYISPTNVVYAYSGISNIPLPRNDMLIDVDEDIFIKNNRPVFYSGGVFTNYNMPQYIMYELNTNQWEDIITLNDLNSVFFPIYHNYANVYGLNPRHLNYSNQMRWFNNSTNHNSLTNTTLEIYYTAISNYNYSTPSYQPYPMLQYSYELKEMELNTNVFTLPYQYGIDFILLDRYNDLSLDITLKFTNVDNPYLTLDLGNYSGGAATYSMISTFNNRPQNLGYYGDENQRSNTFERFESLADTYRVAELRTGINVDYLSRSRYGTAVYNWGPDWQPYATPEAAFQAAYNEAAGMWVTNVTPSTAAYSEFNAMAGHFVLFDDGDSGSESVTFISTVITNTIGTAEMPWDASFTNVYKDLDFNYYYFGEITNLNNKAFDNLGMSVDNLDIMQLGEYLDFSGTNLIIVSTNSLPFITEWPTSFNVLDFLSEDVGVDVGNVSSNVGFSVDKNYHYLERR